MPAPSTPVRQRGSERMPVLRLLLALGLALLLVVGAWSTSHGEADAHAALCLAPGVSAGQTASSGDHHEGAAAADAAADSGAVIAAAICCVVLLLLVLRVRTAAHLVRIGTAPRMCAPPSAGPTRLIPSLTLAQLSLSRT